MMLDLGQVRIGKVKEVSTPQGQGYKKISPLVDAIPCGSNANGIQQHTNDTLYKIVIVIKSHCIIVEITRSFFKILIAPCLEKMTPFDFFTVKN